MDKGLRIAKNTIAMSLGKIVMIIANMVFTIVVARLLGVDGFGNMVALITLYELFRGLVAHGLSVLVTRETAKDRSRTSLFLSNGLLLTTTLTFLAAILIVLMVQTPSYSPSAKHASIVVGLALFAATANVLYEGVIIAYEKVEYITLVTIAESIVRISLSLLVLWLGMGLPELFAMLLLSQAFMLFCYHFLVSHYLVRLQWMPNMQFLRSLVREWSVFGIENGLASVTPRIGVLSLTYILGPSAVGIYAAAKKLLRPGFLVHSFNNALFPHLSREIGISRNASRKIIESSLKYMLILMLPIVVGLFVLADQLINLLYTSEYEEATLLLRILVFGLIANIFTLLYSRALIANGDQQLSLRVAVVKVIVLVITSVAFVLWWGVLGAVIAGKVINLISISLFSYYLSRRVCRVRYHKVLIRPLSAALTMGVITYLLRDLNLLILIPLSALIYLAMLFISGAVTFQEREIIRNLLRRFLVKLGWATA